MRVLIHAPNMVKYQRNFHISGKVWICPNCFRTGHSPVGWYTDIECPKSVIIKYIMRSNFKVKPDEMELAKFDRIMYFCYYSMTIGSPYLFTQVLSCHMIIKAWSASITIIMISVSAVIYEVTEKSMNSNLLKGFSVYDIMHIAYCCGFLFPCLFFFFHSSFNCISIQFQFVLYLFIGWN